MCIVEWVAQSLYFLFLWFLWKMPASKYLSKTSIPFPLCFQYGKMPWLAIPSIQGSAKIKTKLAETLSVSAIPALAIIDSKTGEFIVGGLARDDVVAAAGDKEKVVATINKWKDGPRYPLSAGAQMMDMGRGSQPFLFRLLSFLAKNPMLIFGLIYVYQWTQRKMIEMGFDDGNKPPDMDEPAMEEGEF